ncbi:MAG: hypothetical protein IJ231_09445 [Clostridia bacterium]|nr:hypothetical protein [Clostridia bacterium]
MMIRKGICVLLALMMSGLLAAGAAAETNPLSLEELLSFADAVRALALAEKPQNDPAGEDALSEDGTALMYDFGVIYAAGTEMNADAEVNAFLVMDPEVPGPRGVSVDWTVNQVMTAFPCGNPDMNGTYEQALLYLEGTPAEGYSYGLVERDGQRISAMEYGVADPVKGCRQTLTLHISGDGVTSMRVAGLNERDSAEDLAGLYGDLEALGQRAAYARVPRSLDGAGLEMFQESDLDFSCLSYQTAQPESFGENVEDMLMDNEDGTWLRRVDGEGFSAVFTCDADGRNAELISFTILSPELEGPRGVRLGDLFHEDYQRFRSGEGTLDAAGRTETLYGTVGQAPYGLAEYGDGDEMILRYVTDTLSGACVELLLRYENTALTEITLHTL